MSPIVRMAYFVGVSFLAIIVLLCAAWLATLDYFRVAYGLPEALTFMLVSLAFLALICSMIYHDRR